jgi:hypothetical protein
MLIKVADHCGPLCTTIVDGTKVYLLIKDSKDIILDFEGVTHVAAPFANFAVGRLLEHRTLDEFNEQVKLVNLSEDWEYDFFKLVVRRADRYYRDANYRQAVDSVMEERSQEDYDWH